MKKKELLDFSELLKLLGDDKDEELLKNENHKKLLKLIHEINTIDSYVVYKIFKNETLYNELIYNSYDFSKTSKSIENFIYTINDVKEDISKEDIENYNMKMISYFIWELNEKEQNKINEKEQNKINEKLKKLDELKEMDSSSIFFITNRLINTLDDELIKSFNPPTPPKPKTNDKDKKNKEKNLYNYLDEFKYLLMNKNRKKELEIKKILIDFILFINDNKKN